MSTKTMLGILFIFALIGVLGGITYGLLTGHGEVPFASVVAGIIVIPMLVAANSELE